MTDTTLKNAFLGNNSVNPALSAVANTQKTAQTAANNKGQDFGAVLDKTAQKYDLKPDKTAADGNQQPKTQQPEETVGIRNDETVEVVDAAEGEQTPEAASGKTEIEEVVEEPVEETAGEEEPVDKMTIDEIANALEQIISQIKEILGITDEELLSGMEDLGLQPYDLLDAGNMTQLVTAVSGEDSAISLAANEDLYTALKDITETVDAQVNNLLDSTGLTSGELDAVLQELQEMESRNPESQPDGTDVEILPSEGQEEAAVEMPELSEIPEKGDGQISNAPVIIREDNTKAEQPAKQYDALPENQQENVAEIGTKPQTQNAGKDTRDGDSKESGNFGHDNTSQNFQNNLNEVNDAAVTEGVEKFTSESTENIMRQLADMVKIVRNENLTEMELQLHPASLGTVNVSLSTKGGMVTAQFTTQNEAVKAAIEAQATQLQANLEEQGVKIEAIEVSVESHQMERNLDRNGEQQQKQSQEQEKMRVQGMRRGRSSINLRAFTDGEELEGEMQGADDATRIAMEIMAANGNTMDLLA